MSDREKLIELLKNVRSRSSVWDTTGDIADHLIANGVTVQRHGRWEKTDNLKPKCSECGEYHLYAWPDYKKCHYCPNCGAKMDLKGETE